MAAGKISSLSDAAAITDYAADINTDSQMRAAWLEVAAARMAANLLRTARLRRGLNQADLAQALDVSQARISQVESGRVEDIPSLELMSRFLDACGERLVLASESLAVARTVDIAPVPARIAETTGDEEQDAEDVRQAPASMD